jgi:hypothetical protein
MSATNPQLVLAPPAGRVFGQLILKDGSVVVPNPSSGNITIPPGDNLPPLIAAGWTVQSSS